MVCDLLPLTGLGTAYGKGLKSMCYREFGFFEVLCEPGAPFSSQETKQLKLFYVVIFFTYVCSQGRGRVAGMGILCRVDFQELESLCVSLNRVLGKSK